MKSKKAFLGLSCMIMFSFFGVVLTRNPVLALDVTVCKTGGPCDYTSIGPAITVVSAAGGGTVTVTDNSIYDELVRMQNGVNVVSAPNKAHITHSGSGKDEVVGFSGAMTCDLKGFEITNPGSGAGIFMDDSGSGIIATIENCDIHDCKSAAGIRLNGVISATIIGCNIYSNEWAGIATSEKKTDKLVSDSSVTIEDNLIYQNGTKSDGTAGIFLQGDSGNTVDVVIRGTGEVSKTSRIYNNGQAGIRLEDIYDTVIIDNNEVNNNSKAGICIIDIGSGTATATIQNNNVHDNTQAGITVAGASYLTIGSNNNINNNGSAGVAFRKASIDVFDDPINVSSQPVTITGNNIYSNSYAGIGIIDAITGTVTITDQNDIYQNTRGGIGIQNDCTVVITKNKIRDNVRGGIHTGTQVIDPGGFSGTAGSAYLTIKQNKVYGNGGSDYGGGIDVRHADGTIYNNLVYENKRGGIRFGDWIDEIINNTVVDNGDAAADRGGGIIYDNINILPAEGVNDPPTGTPPATLLIRNNICAYNQEVGIRACFDMTEGSEERNYNLLYGNYRWNSIHQLYNKPDCGWPYSLSMSCTNQQYGGCGAHWEYDPTRVVFDYPNDKMANPLFRHDCLIDDDISTGNTPGNGTFVLFYVHKGYPDPEDTYQITDVRLYGSATSYTWDVYVGNDPLTGCTGSWGTLVKSNWSVGNGWIETSVDPTSGRYIKLVTSGDIDENTIFEFDYKSVETGEVWQTPVMVVYKCTDIATDNYELLADSPAIDAGDPASAYNDTDASRNDIGAYGGPTPLDW